jgi:hypothetical protein
VFQCVNPSQEFPGFVESRLKGMPCIFSKGGGSPLGVFEESFDLASLRPLLDDLEQVISALLSRLSLPSCFLF